MREKRIDTKPNKQTKYKVFCLVVLLLHINSYLQAQQVDKSFQLSQDGSLEKQKKLNVSLVLRDAKTIKPVSTAKVKVSLVVNSKERFKNAKPNPNFRPKLDEIGVVQLSKRYNYAQDTMQWITNTINFYLYYNKEYLVEVISPGYINQKFIIRTTIPYEMLEKLKKGDRKLTSGLGYYSRLVDMIPCNQGGCADTSSHQMTVSFSIEKMKFNMVLNRIVTDENNSGELSSDSSNPIENLIFDSTTQLEILPSNNNNKNNELNTKPSLTIISPSIGSSAYIYQNDTINRIDIQNLRQGDWIYFGADFPESGYENNAKYYSGGYINNYKEGKWIKFYQNADTAAIFNFSRDTFTGNFAYYYPKGSIEKIGTWNSGQKKLNGVYREYYESGELHKECSYNPNGYRTGIQTVYFLNGNIAITANMSNDLLEGYMNYYLQDGRIYLQQLYKNGNLINEKYFGNKTNFPNYLLDATKYLLLENNYDLRIKIQRSISEILRIDSNYKHLLYERDAQMKAAGLLISQKEKDIILIKKRLTRSELENQIKFNEVKRQQIIIWSGVFILILFFLLIVFIYISSTKIKKANRLLRIQKEQINQQKLQIERKSNDVKDSIECAGRIQQALLTSHSYLKRNLTDYFLFFKPRDIVSGDFYWAYNKNEKFYLAICDSTGHGVPGAFMSLLNLSFLTQAVVEKNLDRPDYILNYVRERVIESLNQEGSNENSMEGMDAVMMVFDFNNMKLQLAGANNPIWIIRHNADDKELKEYKGDKQPIGYSENPKPFTLHVIDLKQGDMIYGFSDGYADQFGGEHEKKFKTANLRKLILEMESNNMNLQLEKICSTHENWKGNCEQVDDICVMGIRI
ncbi:MAG: SpoIIE family protein phosphatase [Bacteroidia bacterium]|jgi:serine phosphatase RsbU (regulator of sigma subunit)/antitoxin component YwqK of YwqJK toxin-antitoxin module|nr:SpoIIE family protein phosphatase [Bacteroidia bacterium]